MINQFKLKYDPLRVFDCSKSPAGLYARQKWKSEEGNGDWTRDFDETVKTIRRDQLVNGSWGNSKIATIRGLFSLHLTVRKADDSILRGVDWLLSTNRPSQFSPISRGVPDMACNYEETRVEEKCLHGLPFSASRPDHFVICAVLFLANCFDQGEEKRIKLLYDVLAKEIEIKNGYWFSIYSINNALRAFVTHRQYAASKATAMMVNYLGQHQLPSGRWMGRTPFYMTFNALAHLNSVEARRQCIKALGSVMHTQNRDGSWGRTQKEWNTFLVVHALRRLNAL